MSDDITFCGSECNNKKCFRHPSNIAEPNIPHSFAYLKDTDMCPMKKQEIRLIDANKLKEQIKNRCNNCNDKDTAWCEHCCSVNDWEDYIDNAPTVELTEEQAIDKLHETGWLIRHDKEMTEIPQGDLISRESLKKAIFELPNDNPSYYYTGDLLDRERVLDEIDNAPTVVNENLIAERPQGEWIVTAEDNDGVHRICCPFCSYEKGSNNTDHIIVTFSNFPKFCENCGADMKGGKEE